MKRLVGRRVCSVCGMNFHVDTHPPTEGGSCRSCGGDVIQRTDDCEEAVHKRLEVYHESTKPLKGYFEELRKLVVLDGTGSQEDVFQRLSEIV